MYPSRKSTLPSLTEVSGTDEMFSLPYVLKWYHFFFFSLLTSQSIPALPDHPGMDTAVSGIDGHMKGHVKKPLNAFMLYMKDMRSKVVSECTLKESAAINQILGKRVMPNYRLL